MVLVDVGGFWMMVVVLDDVDGFGLWFWIMLMVLDDFGGFG